MKVFVIGGSCVPNGHQDFTAQLATLEDSMLRIGRSLIRAGHDLLVCSPFPGAADVDAVRGAAEVFAERDGPVVEFHTPNLPAAKEKLTEFTRLLPVDRVRPFFHPVSADEHGEPQLTYTWLLSQMSALDRCQVVLAVGGKLNGSSSLLLPVAENQRKLVLPLTFLGGAAAQSFERRRYELMDHLGDGIVSLQDPRRVDEAVALIETLPQIQISRTERPGPLRVFLSYPNSRPIEADIVEMMLRRKGCEVYRDEENFGAGRSIPGEIREHIHAANVFVAIWCKEYACSPWCFDELELAIKRSGANGLTLWILCVDDTRIVPPAARDLTSYHAQTRDAIERTLLKLLGRFET
jgi:hypothetical protein